MAADAPPRGVTVEMALDIKKQLQEIDHENNEKIVDLLTALDKEGMSLKILSATKIGAVVQKFRKSTNATVSKLAKALISAWKKLVPTPTGSPASTPSLSKSFPPVEMKPEGAAVQPEGAAVDAAPPSPVPASPRGPTRKDDTLDALPLTNVKIRDRIRQYLWEGLNLVQLDADLLIPSVDLAVAIEEIVWERHKSPNDEITQAYKQKGRSLAMALKNKGNETLRQGLRLGGTTPLRLCDMTPMEMASDSVKAQVAASKKVSEHGMRNESAVATTDMFQCGKCKARKTKYFQLQTRSADEPMTTFVTCVNCGNRWKFC